MMVKGEVQARSDWGKWRNAQATMDKELDRVQRSGVGGEAYVRERNRILRREFGPLLDDKS